MTYKEALELVKTEFETRYDSPNSEVVRVNYSYDGFNMFYIAVYDDNGRAILTDCAITREVLYGAEESWWESICAEHSFELCDCSIVREFNSMQDLYDYIKFLDFVSNIWELEEE